MILTAALLATTGPAPAGAREGLKIRVAEAYQDPSSGRKRDLHLVIHIAKDPRFERKGNDLYTTIAVDLYTAVLGGEVSVPTISGEVVLTIPAGTQPEQVFRLAGKGMPHLKAPETYGNLFVNIQVNIPKKLTDRQKDLFQQLARS